MTATALEVDRHGPDWHAQRRQGIGASEIGIIAGLAPESRGSRWQLWAVKTGLLAPDHESSEVMETGTDLEAWLAWKFTKHTGLTVAGDHMMLTCPHIPWARCELDALVFDGQVEEPSLDVALGALETKYHNGGPWSTERCDTVVVPPELHDLPGHYEAQVQWQMLCSGLERAWVGALHAWGKYRIYEVARDQQVIDALVEAAADFWQLVQTDTPPALDGIGRDVTSKALATVFGEGGGGEVDLSHLRDQHAAWVLTKAELKAAKENETDLANEIKAAMGNAEIGLIDGEVAVTWRKTKPVRRIDVDRLRAEQPEIAAEYSTEEPMRRLLPKGTK